MPDTNTADVKLWHAVASRLRELHAADPDLFARSLPGVDPNAGDLQLVFGAVAHIAPDRPGLTVGQAVQELVRWLWSDGA